MVGVVQEGIERPGEAGSLVGGHGGQGHPSAHTAQALGDTSAVEVAGHPIAIGDGAKQAFESGLERLEGSSIPAQGRTVVEGGGAQGLAGGGVEGPAQRLEPGLDTLLAQQGTVEAELPGDVGEEADLLGPQARRSKLTPRLGLAAHEGGVVVEPGVGLEVVLHPREQGSLELAGLAGRLLGHAAPRPCSPVGHAPEVGQHGAQARNLRAQVAGGQVLVQQEVQRGSWREVRSRIWPKKMLLRKSLEVPYQKARKLGLSARRITDPRPNRSATMAGVPRRRSTFSGDT